MNEDKQAKQQNVIFGLIILIIIGVVFVYLYMRAPAGGGAVEAAFGAAGPQQDVQEAVILLHKIKLNTAFLQKEEFRTLKDFSVSVERVTPEGRDNPFLPF